MSLKMKNPMGKRREQQKAETYDLILDSARFLFDTQGFEKTTMRMVAFHAQIALGTIYTHFKNKTSLLAAAFHDDLVRLYDDAIDTLPAHVSIQEQFIHLAGFNYRYYTARPKLSREYLCHIALVDDEWSVKIGDFESAYSQKVTDLVCAAEISGKKDCRFVALSLMADYFFVLGDLFLRQKINDPEQMLAFLKKMINQTIC